MSNHTAANDAVSESDLKRFACCLLHCKDFPASIDWDAAAADFGGNAKVASFKTVTTKAFHKARKAAEGKGGAKRKASADGDEAGASDAQAPAKKKKGKATKKGGKSAAAVKTESGSGEDSDGHPDDRNPRADSPAGSDIMS